MGPLLDGFALVSFWYGSIDASRPRLVIQARPDGQSASKAILSIVKD